MSYICSRSNSVANAHSSVAEIAELSGRRVAIGSDERYLFPTASELVAVGAEALGKLRLTGRRHAGPSVFHAATMVDSANLKPDDLKGHGCGYEQAVAQLRKVNGVGYKIADCVVLFALDQLEAFPVDRWASRAMQQWYADFPAPKGADLARQEHDAIRQWTRQRFGPFAGYAGQYLFYGRRQEEQEAQLAFGARWRGRFAAMPRDEPRWQTLAGKHL